MPMDWMSSGPTPLDLVTPLDAGEKTGAQAAYRQEQVKMDAAKVQDMKAHLGLEQNAQAFQQKVFDSGQSMRDTQLQIAQTNLGNMTRQSQDVADDHDTLSDSLNEMNQNFAADPTSIVNATPPVFKTAAALAEWTRQKASLAQTGQGIMAANTVSDQSTMSTALTSAGFNPKDFVDTNGQLDMNLAGDALNTFKNGQLDNASQRQAYVWQQKQAAIGDRQIQYLQTKSALDGSMNKMSDIDKQAYRDYETQRNGAMRAKSMLLKGPDDPQYGDLDTQQSQAEQGLQTLRQKYSPQATASPTPGAQAPASQTPAAAPTPAAGTPPVAQEGKVYVNPTTGARVTLRNGQWYNL